MEDFEWRSSESIENHIKKHITNLGSKEAKQEKKFWEEEFDPDYTSLTCGVDQHKKGTKLYERYKSSSIENIQKAGAGYIFKTNNGSYSVNFTDNKNNNLTTGLQLNFEESSEFKSIKISTCYFKVNNTILDSTILYTAEYILENDLDNKELENIEIPGLKVYKKNYINSISFAAYESRDLSIDFVRKLLWKYFELQFDSENRSKEEWQEHLIDKLSIGKSNKCKVNRKQTIDDLRNRLKDLAKLEYGFEHENEDIKCEKSFIELGILALDENYKPKQKVVKLMKEKGIFKH